MKRHLFRSLVLAVALLFMSLAAAVPGQAREPFISPEEGRNMIEQQKDIVILDVRNPNEYVVAHYEEALNIPVTELKDRVGEIPQDKTILIHCARGRRAERAYNMLREELPTSEIFFIKGEPIF